MSAIENHGMLKPCIVVRPMLDLQQKIGDLIKSIANVILVIHLKKQSPME